MAESSHSIQITLDASRAQAGLKALSASVRETSRDLQSLGSANSGGNFANLSRSLSSLGNGFESLRRQTSQDSGLSNLSREISMLSRGMPVAAREIVALASSFIVSRNAIALFAGALGSVGIGKFASDAIDVGNKFMSLRFAIDASATSSHEVGQQMKFLFDLADSTGSRVEDLTNNFRNLDAAMRSSGASVADVQKVTKAFATIGSVLHLQSSDLKTVQREIQETFSIGAVHAQQLTRSIALHIPGMMSIVKDAMHMTGEEIHKTFAKGGFDPNVLWPAVADTILAKYGSALPEALNHSNASLNSLANAWTKLKLSAFDNGIDQAVTQLSKHLTGLATGSAIESIGRTIGTGFRAAAAGVTILVDQIIAAKEPLLAFFGTFAVVPAIRIAMMGLGAAFAFATSPITILATLAAITATNWDKLKDSFGGSDSILVNVANAIGNIVARLFDLNKAAKGALELYAMGKNLLSGNGWSASLNAARQAGADFDASAKQSGKTFAQSWFDGAKGTLDSATKWLEGRFAGVTGEYNKLMSDSTPHGFQGAGNYAANRELYAHKDNSLSEELRREYEKLLPTTAALKHYRDTLADIDRMKGKLYDGRAIGDAEIQKLKDAARANALEHLDPTASRISDKLAELKAYQDFTNRGGDMSQWQTEKEILNEKLALKKKGLEMSSAEEQALRKILEVEKEIAKSQGDGFTSWARSQKDSTEALNDNIRSSMDSVADGITKIATEGKGKFRSLGEAIRSELADILRGIARNFLNAGLRSLMSEAIKGMNLGQLFGGSGLNAKINEALGLGKDAVSQAGASIDDAAKALSQTTTGTMEVQAGVVNVNGAIGGASGLDAFKPGSSVSNAINPSAVGGISPSNAATSPLFSNDNGLASLPGFKDSVRTGGLGNIPANSASLFGAGLNPSQALGMLPGFKDVIKSSADTITRNSVAAFGQGLQKLAPVADRAGVTSISGGSGNLATLAGREQYAWNFFKSKGYSDQDAAKLLGNIRQESSFNPHSLNPNDSKTDGGVIGGRDSHGLGQWNKERWGGLQQFAAQRGKPWTDYETQLGYMHHEIQTTPYYRNALRNSRDAGSFGHAYEGFGDDSAGTRAAYGNQYLKRFGGKSAGIDPTSTGSITKLTDSTKKLEEEARKAVQPLQGMTQPLQGMETSVTKLSSTMAETGVQSVQSFEQQIQKLIEQMMSGMGGSGGLGGLASEGASLLGGLFSEGGYSGSPVSSAAMPASFWSGAPHYAEGTANTSGGMPAILHPNEAVIPLSRGRSIPVEINSGGDNHTNTSNIVNVHLAGVNDFHSFRRSKGQIGSAMMQELSRLHIRNG